ncbi:MAG: U32 family peptidase [Treponema sp.]|nr:U32 family peptidase [Treponema sp.]
MNIPELLAPAGTPEALDAAIAEGADAVYLGLKNFNARMRSSNFAYSQFESALKTLRRMGKKLYVTVNTVFEEREADRMYQLLKYLNGLGPDGILVQDFGVIIMARENFPALKLHASTQMNIACSRGVNLLSRYGFSRAVLARELSLEEIRDIRKNTNMELEVFVHGALCICVSGLCLFSSYLGGKSANRGMCTQACRRLYTPENTGDGAYYFSPGDLQLMEKIPDLCEAGVNSFKIEGRMKSAEYVGTVVSAYRLVLDSIGAGNEETEKAVKKAAGILCNDFAREKTVFLFNGEQDISWLNPGQSGGTGIPLGKILKVKENEKHYGLISNNTLLPDTGDTIRIHRADDTLRVSHKITEVEDEAGEIKSRWVTIPPDFRAGDSVYLIQTKSMTKRYPKIINIKPESNVRGPGRDRAAPPMPPPEPGRQHSGNETGGAVKKTGRKTADLGEGIYVQVSRVEDLYTLQSRRPVKAILSWNHRLYTRLTGKNKADLPFDTHDLIISLDPFLPQNLEAELAQDMAGLADRGFKYFIMNNPGHFSIFKNLAKKEITLIAGPWLYFFNSWAQSFLKANGSSYFVSPLENNRQNLERTFGSPAGRRQVFITVYSRPPLFRIRSSLGSLYNFKKLRDSQDEGYMPVSSPAGTLVYPERFFYIADKIPFLKEAGFKRFIVDWSSEPVNKTEYRELMNAAGTDAVSHGASRFNWKDGFYRDPEKP